MKIENIKATLKVEGKDNETMSTADVLIEALCAYRDHSIMSPDWDSPRNSTNRMLITMAIDDIRNTR